MGHAWAQPVLPSPESSPDIKVKSRLLFSSVLLRRLFDQEDGGGAPTFRSRGNWQTE